MELQIVKFKFYYKARAFANIIDKLITQLSTFNFMRKLIAFA